MQPVGRTDSALLDRPGDLVNLRGEVRLRAVHGGPYASGALAFPPSEQHSERALSGTDGVLPVPGLHTSARGARARARRGRALQPLRPRRDRRRGVRGAAQSRAGALAGHRLALGRPRARPTVAAIGGYAGDFATVLACRSRLRRADVVFSTVDTVGIPLSLLAHATRLSNSRRVRGDRAPGAPRAAADGLRARALQELVPAAALDRRVRLGRGGRASCLARRKWPDRDVRPLRRGHRVLPPGARSARWTPTSSRRRRSTARLRAAPRARAPATRPLVPARRLGGARPNARRHRPERPRRDGRSVRRSSAIGSPLRASSCSRSGTTATRARRRRCSRRWRAASPSSSPAPRRSHAATTSRTA